MPTDWDAIERERSERALLELEEARRRAGMSGSRSDSPFNPRDFDAGDPSSVLGNSLRSIAMIGTGGLIGGPDSGDWTPEVTAADRAAVDARIRAAREARETGERELAMAPAMGREPWLPPDDFTGAYGEGGGSSPRDASASAFPPEVRPGPAPPPLAAAAGAAADAAARRARGPLAAIMPMPRPPRLAPEPEFGASFDDPRTSILARLLGQYA